MAMPVTFESITEISNSSSENPLLPGARLLFRVLADVLEGAAETGRSITRGKQDARGIGQSTKLHDDATR